MTGKSESELSKAESELGTAQPLLVLSKHIYFCVVFTKQSCLCFQSQNACLCLLFPVCCVTKQVCQVVCYVGIIEQQIRNYLLSLKFKVTMEKWKFPVGKTQQFHLESLQGDLVYFVLLWQNLVTHGFGLESSIIECRVYSVECRM